MKKAPHPIFSEKASWCPRTWACPPLIGARNPKRDFFELLRENPSLSPKAAVRTPSAVAVICRSHRCPHVESDGKIPSFIADLIRAPNDKRLGTAFSRITSPFLALSGRFGLRLHLKLSECGLSARRNAIKSVKRFLLMIPIFFIVR
jgi:hypothetical protein